MSARTRVKICGITRVEDALEAARLGADALGFVFVPASGRAVDIDAARRICAALPAFVTRVGLFLNAAPETVARTLDALPDLVPQFHGTESAAECEAYGLPYLKALPLGGEARTIGMDPAAAYRSATGFLVDSHAPGALGGTGVALDWSALGPTLHALGGRPLVLAGGLEPGNVGEALHAVRGLTVPPARPWAVDVSSGVESAKGIKDHARMDAFVRAVRDADAAAGAAGATDTTITTDAADDATIDTSLSRDGGRAA